MVVVFFSIKELINSKKLPNNSYYNVYQNSRFYRLLILVIACVIGLILVLVKKIFY